MFDIITIGSATLDIFVRSKNIAKTQIDGEEHLHFLSGAKLEAEEVLFETGGGGTNSAVTFARQNLKTAVLAKIGADFAGDKVLTELAKDHIDTSFIVKDPNDITDLSTILWSPSSGTTILTYRGKTKLEEKDIPWDKISAKWVYISSVEGNLKIVRDVVEKLPEINIAWNPGKRELSQKEELLNIIPKVKIMIVNRVEILDLLGLEHTTEIPVILKSAEKLPCSQMLITDGHHGSYFWDGKTWTYSGVFKIERLESTGAGDAYGSAFVAGLAKNLSVENTLKLAAANAASVVTATGAKRGILTEEQAKEWMGKDLEIRKI